MLIKNITQLLNERSDNVDELLCKLWSKIFSNNDVISLIATGGYGRRELHPHSDIDVLMVLANDNKIDHKLIEKFIASIWDQGLKIGHSVHKLDACIKNAKTDLILATSIMESRHLAGCKILHDDLVKATDYQRIWQPKAFFLAKRRELKMRHKRYSDNEYNLEPNIKNSPGALRDIQTVTWVILRDALNNHPLSKQDQVKLKQAKHFLWQIRYALHVITGTNEDRLLFPLQVEIAKMLGFKANNVTSEVNQLMSKYYQTVTEVSVLSEIVLLNFAQRFLTKSGKNKIRSFALESISKDTAKNISKNTAKNISNKQLLFDAKFLQINGDYLEFIDGDCLAQNSSLLLSIFVVLAYNPKLKGITANAIECIRKNLMLIDDDFRQNPINCALFLSLFEAKSGIHRNLRRMNRYGVLARYLPEFGAISYRTQHDLFHIYTVDAHTLNLIKHLRKLRWPELIQKYSLASSLIEQISKPHLLYLAGLLHDIGKNGQGNHSVIGAQIAEQFCKQHNIANDDANLIVWLVRNHLLLSLTAQHQDIGDRDVIANFADAVGNVERLDYLYLLTVADINATNPKLWNSWRASLLRKLYENTKNYFGVLNKEITISNSIQDGLKLVLPNYQNKAKQLLSNLDDEYVKSLSADDLAWQINAVIAHDNENTNKNTKPLVIIRQINVYQHEGGTQIFIYLKDQAGIFATTTAVLAGLNLKVQDARIVTSKDGFAWDTYLVLDAKSNTVESSQIDNIKQQLSCALIKPSKTPHVIKHRLSPTVRYLAANPVVNISNNIRQKFTQVDVITADRPSVVATLGQIFVQFKLRIYHAKITTLGVKVADTFFISTYDGKPLHDSYTCEQLKQTIIKQLTI